jgi:hypothetical protein
MGSGNWSSNRLYKGNPPRFYHDPATGDVVLSRKPTDWQGLLDVVAQNKEDDLLIERRQTHARRDPFEGC